MELIYITLAVYGMGAATALFPKKMEMAAHYCAVLAAVFGSGALLYQSAAYMMQGSGSLLSGSWAFFTFNADRWSAVFLLITGLAGTVTSIYAWGYAKSYLGKRLRLLGGLWNAFLLSMVLVLLAADVFSFLLAWELMAVVSFLLVNHEAEKKAAHNAAYQYLVMTHIGTAAIMIAFLMIGSQAGSLDFSVLGQGVLSDNVRNAAFITAFAGFALKAGLLPLHVWLPNAHPAAPCFGADERRYAENSLIWFRTFCFSVSWPDGILVGGFCAGGRSAISSFGCFICTDGKRHQKDLSIFICRKYGNYFRSFWLWDGTYDNATA